MHMFGRFNVALALAGFLSILALPAFAAPPPNISQSVAICDPWYPSRCVQPAASTGAIPVTGSFTPSGTQTVNLGQVNGAAVNVGAGASGTGTQRVILSSDSPAPTGAATAANQTSTQGSVAGGAAATASQLVGATYLTTPGTLTDGQQAALLLDTRRSLKTTLCGADQATCVVTSTPADGQSSSPGIVVRSENQIFATGGLWSRMRGLDAASAAGTGTVAVAMAPTSSALGAIAPISSTAAEGSRVFKGGAGNVYRVSVTAGAAAGYLMIFNATSAPADGAVTPAVCRPVAANASAEATFGTIPAAFTTGITAVFSITGCFTKTVSATAFFEGYTQ